MQNGKLQFMNIRLDNIQRVEDVDAVKRIMALTANLPLKRLTKYIGK